jgi:hypothetical protein
MLDGFKYDLLIGNDLRIYKNFFQILKNFRQIAYNIGQNSHVRG